MNLKDWGIFFGGWFVIWFVGWLVLSNRDPLVLLQGYGVWAAIVGAVIIYGWWSGRGQP